MSSERVAADPSSLTPRAARAQAEDTIGARLRGWINRSGATIKDTAAMLGMHRPEVYDLIEGERSVKLAWLECLPVEVQRVALAEYAERIGYELVPAAVDDEHDDGAVRLIHELTDVIRATSTTQADNVIDKREALAELREIEELEAALARRKARLRRATSTTRMQAVR